MKKITLILASILVFASFCYAANGFKEGNKLYLGGKYQDALGQYQQFIQNNPEYYEGYFNAGNALFRQEQYDNALGMYKKAQEINPKDPDIQYNIDVTQKKMQEKQKQCDNPKDGKDGENKKNQDGKQGQNSKGKSQNGDQNQQQSQNGQQQGQKQQGQQSQAQNQEKQPPSGMTEDEVQALLNQKQNQEKRLQGYFGKQYQKQNEQDMFNMSPQQIMQYMMQKQMDPNFEPPQQGGKGGNEKDW